MFAQALSTPKAKQPPFWWRQQKQYLIFSSKALHSQPLLGAGMAVVTWGMPSALCFVTEPAAENTANSFQSKEILQKQLRRSPGDSPLHRPWH